MPSNDSKPGLADLKRLRQLAQAADTPASVPTPPKRKRRKFMTGGQTPTAGPKTRVAAPPATYEAAGEDTPTPNLAAEDKALFRKAVASVQPMTPPNRAILPPAPTAPPSVLKQKRQAAMGQEVAAPSPVSDQYAPARLAADASHFLQAGYGPDLLKKLERGYWPVEASLDLHGSTLDEARLRMDRFLSSCLQHGIKSVRVVHGKGHGSKNNAPVLKDTVRRWLTQLEDVKAYVECAERDGGAGAVLVLLKTLGT